MGLWATLSDWRFPCSLQGDWASWPLKVPSNPKHSMIPWFYLPFTNTLLFFDPTVSRHLEVSKLVQGIISHAHLPPTLPMNFGSVFPCRWYIEQRRSPSQHLQVPKLFLASVPAQCELPDLISSCLFVLLIIGGVVCATRLVPLHVWPCCSVSPTFASHTTPCSELCDPTLFL